MPPMNKTPAVLALLTLALGCGDDPGTNDDAGTEPNDGALADAGPGPLDAGVEDDAGSAEDGGPGRPSEEELLMLLPSGSPSIDDHVDIEITVEQPNTPPVTVDVSETSLVRNVASVFRTNGTISIEVPVPNGGDNVYRMDISFLPERLAIPGLHPVYAFTGGALSATEDAPVIGIMSRSNTFGGVAGGVSTGQGAIRFDNCPPESVDPISDPSAVSTPSNRLEITLGQVVFGGGDRPLTVSGFISVPVAFGDGTFCN